MHSSSASIIISVNTFAISSTWIDTGKKCDTSEYTLKNDIKVQYLYDNIFLYCWIRNFGCLFYTALRCKKCYRICPFLLQWVTPSGRRWTSPASRGCTWAPTSARLTTASHQRQGKTLKFRFIVSIATFKHRYLFTNVRADRHDYFKWIDKDGRKANSSKTLLYLSGLNMMEGILTKSNWLRFPPSKT